MDLLELRQLHRNFKDYEGKEVTVGGWVRSIRDSKTFGFMVLNDGTFFEPTQIVFADKLDNFEEIAKLNVGAAVIVSGEVVVTPDAKQPFEIQATNVLIEGVSAPEYPLQKKRHSFEYLRTISHLRPRTNTFQAVFRVRSLCAYAIHKFFQERDFVYVHTPLITSSDAEGAGEMFQVTTLDLKDVPLSDGNVDFSQDFFNKPTNLTVSGQLNGETFAMAFKNIYTFGPTFRAENSNTTRHAAEFWMIEPEIAFMDLPDLMDLEEDFIKYCVKWALDNCKDDLEFLNKMIDKGLIERLEGILKEDFVRLDYTEGIRILQQAIKDGRKFEFPCNWGDDLASEHERYLVEEYFKKPVIMTHYPKAIKAFYMKIDEKNPVLDGQEMAQTVQGTDVLFPQIGEIIGGSVREEDYGKLMGEIEERQIPMKDMWWYLDTRKFGSCPHAGFGLGFERLILFVTGMQNIRDVIPFPRTPKTAEF